MLHFTTPLRSWRRASAVLATAALAAVAIIPANVVAADHEEGAFQLVVANAKLLPCLAGDTTPSAQIAVERGELNDTLHLHLKNIKPNLNFDLFTVQRSNKLADGTPDPSFKNFGLAWYQTDVHADQNGTADVTIKTT